MSENNKYVYNVEIDTMEDAKAMVSVATKLKGKIVLRSGSKFSVNAKSLLGVLLAKKLNWSDITLVAEEECYAKFAHFIVE
jgi:phosphotransferase system HPr-like phosphotransfer protein